MRKLPRDEAVVVSPTGVGGAEKIFRNQAQMARFRIDVIIGPFTISACLNRLSQPSHGMARRTQRGKQVLVACQLRRQDS